MSAVTNAEIATHIATALGHVSKTKAKNKVIVLKPKPQQNKRLDKIIDRIVQQHEDMKETFREYCKAALEEGFTAKEAWHYIHNKLKNVIAKSTLYDWANKELPLEAKNNTKPRTKKIPDSESIERERYQEENDDERAEIYEIPLNDAKPEDVDKYDVPALRRLLKEALERLATLQRKNKA